MLACILIFLRLFRILPSNFIDKDMILATDAIILHSRKFGDTSKIVTAYSSSEGRISLVAKGARTLKSKFGAALEPLSISTLTYYKKQGRELHTLSKAETSIPLRRISQSAAALAAGFVVAETLSLTQEQEAAQPGLFELAKETLMKINDNMCCSSAALWFQLRTAELMGFMLNMHKFVDDDQPIVAEQQVEYSVSIPNGALLSPEVGAYTTGFTIPAADVSLLQTLLSINSAANVRVDMNDEQTLRLNEFMAQYLNFHLDKRMKYRSQRIMLETSPTLLGSVV